MTRNVEKQTAAPTGPGAIQATSLPEPSPLVQKAIAQARKRVSARAAAPTVSGTMVDNKLVIASSHADCEGWGMHLKDAFGTASSAFASCQLHALLHALRQQGSLEEAEINGALAMLHGLAPCNELEAALAVQIVASHIISLRMLGKAARADLTPQLDSLVNATTKLQRTFVAQVEALASIRRGGKQQVNVRHVHVHQGANGQAIVGDVHHKGRGTPGRIESGRQSRAATGIEALGFATGEEVWSEDEERKAVPVARSRR